MLVKTKEVNISNLLNLSTYNFSIKELEIDHRLDLTRKDRE